MSIFQKMFRINADPKKAYLELKNQDLSDDNALKMLRPSQTVPYFMFLNFRLSKDRSPSLLAHVLSFANAFNVGLLDIVDAADLVEFSDRVYNMAVDQSSALAVSGILLTLATRISPIESFTPFHLNLVKACLRAKTPSHALSILDSDIVKYGSKYSVNDFLLYYFYGALVYLQLKSLKKAASFLQMCIAVPTLNAVSAIQIEARKRLILVELLLQGYRNPLPPFLSQAALSNFSLSCSVYADFATAYETGNFEMLKSLVSEHTLLFEHSKNFGLVQQCLANFVLNQIQIMTKTYLVLTLDQIAHGVANYTDMMIIDPQEILLRMVKDRKVEAKINQSNGKVVFEDGSDDFNTLSTTKLMNSKVAELISIEHELEQISKKIALSKDYVTFGDSNFNDEMN